jgi:transcriptional regulator with XRE-family HTH domain
MSPIHLRVKELRAAKGWTQSELAERAGIRQATLSDIETEKTRGVDFDVLEALAKALGVEPAFLIATRR